MKLMVRMERCKGCGRLSQGRAPMEWCRTSNRMERNVPVWYYHRFVVVAAVFVCGTIVKLIEQAS